MATSPNYFINSTKFGGLNFEGVNGTARVSTANNATFGAQYEIGGNTYYFIPESYVLKGVVNNGKQLYSPSLLNKDNLNRLYNESELVDLGSDINNPASKLGSKGFLMRPETYQDLFATGRRTYNINTKVGKAKVGEITGLSEIKGNLVYSAKAKGGDDKASAWIQPPGTDPYDGAKVKGAGNIQARYIEGGPLYSFGKSIAEIPFLPEIAGFVTGNPYVYATAKGLAGGASGKDPLQVGLEAGATIFASNLLSDAISAPTPVGGTPGVSEVYPVDMGYTAPGVPIPPIEIATAIPANQLAFPGVEIGANSTPVPGSFQATLPELGVNVPAGATAVPGSFAAALPTLLSPAAAASALSMSDVFRGARAINSISNLMDGGQEGVPQRQELPGMQATGVDLLRLPQFSAGTPNIASLLAPMRYNATPSFDLITGQSLLPPRTLSLLG